ncbi:hypothetical protein HHK36_017824 [Tetracentron sinense]|uniref:DUF7806 domain-containing protein n=1 Tax=Tetracentron sinense TaxID=13715 RepID=A0A835DAQ2_TETSI|nr:hypothetical protein HHK36_017824 [Tetracentron sinense]
MTFTSHICDRQNQLYFNARPNKELSEEVEKLCNLQREALCCSTKDDKNENRQLGTPSGGTEVGSRDLSYGSTRKMTRKRTRHAMVLSEGARVNPHASGQVEKALVRDPETYSYKGTLSNDALKNIQQKKHFKFRYVSQIFKIAAILFEYCLTIVVQSHFLGGGIYDAGPANCMFQALMGCLVGMKLSMVNQTEGICVSALHQSSGNF